MQSAKSRQTVEAPPVSIKENIQANSRLMAKRQELLELQQKQQVERRQQQEKLRSKIKPLAKKDPIVLEDLDWKETSLYTQCAVKRVNINFHMEDLKGAYLREEDLPGVFMKVRRRRNETKTLKFDIEKFCMPYLQQSLVTLEVLTKELLTEQHFMHVLDPLISADTDPLQRLFSILEKIRSLFELRRQAVSFLTKIFEREVSTPIVIDVGGPPSDALDSE